MGIWNYVYPEFTPEENWGSYKDLSGLTLFMLITIRRETGWPMSIHNAVETKGHSATGQHPKGTAVDWHFVTVAPFEDQVRKVLDILEAYQLSNFVGLGIYPHWNNPGFHTDSRGEKARWSFDKSGKMVAFEQGLKGGK